jgi:hypothetical protein
MDGPASDIRRQGRISVTEHGGLATFYEWGQQIDDLDAGVKDLASAAYLSAFESMAGAAIRHALSHVTSMTNPFPRGEVPDLVLLVELTRS